MNQVPLTLALLACMSLAALAQDGPKGSESAAEETEKSLEILLRNHLEDAMRKYLK